MQQRADCILQLLDEAAAAKALDPFWLSRFWKEIARLEGTLEAPARAALLGQGYMGAGTVSAPRVDDLWKELEALPRSGMPAHGAGPGQQAAGVFGAGERICWNQ